LELVEDQGGGALLVDLGEQAIDVGQDRFEVDG